MVLEELELENMKNSFQSEKAIQATILAVTSKSHSTSAVSVPRTAVNRRQNLCKLKTKFMAHTGSVECFTEILLESQVKFMANQKVEFDNSVPSHQVWTGDSGGSICIWDPIVSFIIFNLTNFARNWFFWAKSTKELQFPV
jgi:hypothetical protein